MRKTFSLVEVLISAVILFFIVGAVLSVLTVGDKTWRFDMGLVKLQQRTRQGMHGVVSELRQGSMTSINITNSDQTIQFNIPGATNFVRYDLSGTQVVRTHAGNTTVLTSDIDNLTFCCWHSLSSCDDICVGTNFVQIEMNAQDVVRGETLTFNLTEKVRVRNE